MSNPKISVIVPVYNVEKYLFECLDSIVDQTLKDIEIICVNDGSTDNSLSILKKYASKDNRIKIIDKKNEGQGYARKVGIDNANGKYILFCDSDDYYAELTAFEELYNYIEKVKSDVVIFDFIQKDEITKNINNFSDTYTQNVIFTYRDIENIFDHVALCWQKIYSKDFLTKYDDWYFPKHVKYEDVPFHYQVILRAKILYFSKSFYVWRIRQNSTSTKTFSNRNILDNLIIIKKIYEITRNLVNNLEFLDYFYQFFCIRLLNFFIRDSIFIKDIDVIKQIIDMIKSFDTFNLFDLKNREAYFYIRAGLRMTPENYMEYLNRKILRYSKKQIKDRDNIIKNLDNAVKERDGIIQDFDNAVKEREKILKDWDIAIKDRNKIINNLNNTLKDRDSTIENLYSQTNIQNLAIKQLQNSWSYRIGRLFTYPLSIPLEFFKFIRDYNLIKKSNLFDSEYYLANNEDVKNAKMDPIKHYLKFGWKEGRNPSLKFDGNEYLNKRPDVRVAGICPLVHYLKFGKNEDSSFIFEKINNLESENKTLEAKLNEKSIEFEQLNRKKSELDIKLAETTKDFEKLNKKVTDLENFKNDIQFIYNRGINKEKISFEIEKFFESSELGITTEKRVPELIVSLTSYPDRMYDIHYSIYSLLKQNLKPNKIILWLAEEQFPNRDKDLPKNIVEFTKYGLIIKYIKDLKSYNKLIPALNEYPDSLIVTADDDIFYPQNWLEKLYNCWEKNRDYVVCHRAHRVGIENEKLIPYNNWEYLIIDELPSFYNFCTTGGGVLYPPNCFYKDVLNEELFMKLAPNADDIWFWAMVVLNDKKIKIVDEPINVLFYINPAREILNYDGSTLNGDSTLYSKNIYENDRQLENVLNHYPQIMEKLLND